MSVAAVSGSASFSITEAANAGVDLLITGEVKHELYHIIKEHKLNVISAGHYNTETLGVKALSHILRKRFNIEAIFVDIPTGL